MTTRAQRPGEGLKIIFRTLVEEFEELIRRLGPMLNMQNMSVITFELLLTYVNELGQVESMSFLRLKSAGFSIKKKVPVTLSLSSTPPDLTTCKIVCGSWNR